MSEPERLQQAIALQESLRGTVDDAVLDSTIAALREKLAALETPAQQRKLATILFMDIAGHTALVRDLDPEENMALIDPAIVRMAAQVDAFGGHVARYQGDGFKAVFGLPVAQENDPDNAVRAGLAILGEADRIEKELKSEWNIERFKVRVGIDTGLVLSGGESEGQDTIKGAAVNLAARLESTAAPGTLVISHNTFQHVRGVFDLQPLAPIQAKGFDEPVAVYRVLSQKARSFRTRKQGVEGVETRMIGRDRELSLLQEILGEVVDEGERQMATIVGEAGVGKSRLLYEFENWADLQPATVRLYRGRAYLETRQLPYGLLRSIFSFRFSLQDNDAAQVVREKWMSGFQRGWEQSESPESQTSVQMRGHILGHLLGMDFSESPHVRPVLQDPQQLRDRSLVYLLDYFRAVAQSRPVLILLEDMHWADDSSLDVLSQLGVRLGEAGVMVVGAARPGLYERRPYWFEGRDFHHRVDLKPLSRRACRELVKEVLQRLAQAPDELTELIVGHAEGNPFYVEELVKVLVEAGVIVASQPDWIVDHGRLAGIEVPSTLTGVLQARLERLAREERTLIQQASVVGRVFWDQAVWYLNHQGSGDLEEADIETGLVKLRRKELIYRRELSTFVEAQEYLFKHAVLREVTYEGVLKRLRRVYHRLVAEWLIEQRGHRTAEVVGLIADHLERAGRRSEALRYLGWAGEEAAAKYANEEAIDYCSRALALLPEGQREKRFELLLAREQALGRQAQWPAQRRDLEELEALAAQLGDVDQQMEIGVRWSKYHFATDDYEAAAEKAQQVVEQANAVRNGAFAARGHLAGGDACLWLNQLKSARQHLQAALAGFRAIGDRRREGRTLRSLGVLAATEYDYPAWQEFSKRALRLARQIGDRVGEAEANNHLAIIAQFLADYDSARQYYEQYLLIARETGSRKQENFALTNLGALSVDLQDYAAAQGYFKKAETIAREIASLVTVAASLIGLGDSLAGLKQWDQACRSYQEALDLLEEGGPPTVAWLARAGIARAKMGLGERKEAQKFVEAFLGFLEAGGRFGMGFGGTYRLLQVYLFCAQVLQAKKDPQAEKVLGTAYSILEELAVKIKDEDMRRSFLEKVPQNREIVRLWEAQRTER